MKMKQTIVYLLTLCFFALVIGCGEAQTSDGTDADISSQAAAGDAASASVAVPEDKAERCVFSGRWVSDDEQTVVPILVHLYEDGTLVLEAHENKAGDWKENDDGSYTLHIDGTEYTAKYSIVLKTMLFRYSDTIGDEPFDVQLTVARSAEEIAEENNQAMIASIRASEPEEAYEGNGGEVIFYGGSNFQKWTTLESDLSEYPVVNKSIGGSNDPIRREFISERVYSRNPAVVFYMSSTNDWTSGQSKEDIMAYKQEMFGEMGATLPNTVYVILSSTPNPLRYFGEYHDGMVEVDQWTEAYCETHDNFEFLNVVPPLSLEEGVEPNPDLWQSDRLHLNEEGYAILTGLVKDELSYIEDNYPVVFAEHTDIEDDGPEQQTFWSRDWSDFAGWMEENFEEKDVSYLFKGTWEMDGQNAMSFDFTGNLYADGSLTILQHSDTRGDFTFFGYWTERDTEKGNRLTLTVICETSIDGTELIPHEFGPYRMFEENGGYSFSFDFGIIPGNYMRAVDLTGEKTELAEE